ncbi:DUF4169 family protein [Sphingomonas sp. PAMC 26605]|uniref:DUF4169 family protein n=1 Tax=Sphingomonas sp. PAMC 26605 TaxID=1112214 RepID=UPI00026CA617|nr:DUF4169 family protein [Sphingomonas sp. PAMC 26605]
MGEVVNLRRARKARARDAAETTAAANRAAFGRSKDERDAAAIESARHARTLDGAKRED